MKHLNIFLLLLLMLLISCGKDDKKPEYVDESKTNQPDKKEDVKSDTSKNTLKDTSASQEKTTSDKTTSENNPSHKKEFLNEEPVAVVSPLNASDYTGKTVTVKGYVADVYKSDKVAYLNFVEKYPDNPFTAVIFASKFSDFPEIEKYKSKNVEVTGRVSMYRSKPQIILNSTSQIKVSN